MTKWSTLETPKTFFPNRKHQKFQIGKNNLVANTKTAGEKLATVRTLKALTKNGKIHVSFFKSVKAVNKTTKTFFPTLMQNELLLRYHIFNIGNQLL